MTTQQKIGTKLFTLLAILFLGLHTAHAQFKYGFKTGLNFASMRGPSEMNDAGEDLESWKNTTGFHIGMTFGYKFTDNFGVRAEFMYSKRGAKYAFEGESYRVFRHSTGEVLTLGNSRYLINVNNSYLDLPVLLYARAGDFEFSGGGYVGLLVSSTGEGSLRYSGKTAGLGNDVFDLANNNKELVFNFSHNYRKDKAGAGASGTANDQTINVRADAFVSEMPKTLGAYYDFPEDKGRLYRTLDYGLVGGVTYYLSRALYFSARLQYGLADITNNAADLAKSRVGTDGELLYREDKDRNFVIQASVGFSF